MTRVSGLAPFALLVVACCLLGQSLAQSGAYYPSQAGSSWTYDSGETQTISGPRLVAGVEAMVLTHYFDGVPVSEDYLVYSDDGVENFGSASGGEVVTYIPPLLVYGPAPLEVGQSWQSTTRVSGLEITLAAEVLGLQGVETTAGRFNALQIRQTTTTSSGAQTRLDLYFVPTVGVVRFVTPDGTTIELIEKSP